MDELSSPDLKDEAVFSINGKLYRAGADLPVNTSLNTFIRENALLTGTKFMCKEGSCGACVVNIKYYDKTARKQVSLAVNSCLMPVLACHGCAVTTVEGLGSRATGYNKVQTTLAHFNGTQCGMCSPGFVMSMYSLLDGNPKATVQDVENNFSGNLCRCTGYRPILDAFKSLASNPPTKLKQKLLEIEDSHLLCPYRGSCGDPADPDKCKSCMNTSEDDSYELDFSEMSLAKDNFYINGPNGEYYRPMTVKEIFEIFDKIGHKSYILLAGNTARGTKPPDTEPSVYIDVNNINELKAFSMTSSSLVFGSMTRLYDYLVKLRQAGKNKPSLFGYGIQMAHHLELVANMPVRNRATIGGNLGLVNSRNNFPSDIFLLLDAVGATITVALRSGATENIAARNFLNFRLNKKVITKVSLPARNSTTQFISYKVMPASQNAISIVNAAFMYDIKSDGTLNQRPSLVFSGINSSFRHADNTERSLQGKNIFDAKVLQQTLNTLYNEIKPDNELTRFSPQYRQLLSVGLLYKSVLNLADERVDAKLRSGATTLTRPISSGKQVYQSDKSEYPITQPIPKLEAQIQCSGEAKYINDMPKTPDELCAQLVLAKKLADYASIDASKALKIPGVVAFYSFKDIPGTNNVCFPFISYFEGNVELFSSGPIKFWGQPIGMIVAKSQDIADYAVNQVNVTYKRQKSPLLLTIRDVLNSKETATRVKLIQNQKAKSPGTGGKYDFSGEVDITSTGQYAHAMETPTCRVLPQEEGQFQVYCSTQTITVTNASVSQVMNIPLNKIDTIVPRVGGSYGSKNTSQLFGVCACTLAASKLQKPVRMVMTVPGEMDSIGKRTPFYCRYKGKCDDKGKVQGMTLDCYTDYGFTVIMDVWFAILGCLINYFDADTWDINVYNVLTDKTPMLILRGPGFIEAISIIEQIMDHIAFVSKLNPIDVRLANSADEQINKYINDWVQQTDFKARKEQIDKYNSENRWKKKGISLSAMRYPFAYTGNQLGCSIGILYPDGTVQVQHAGIEMGQGLYTKVIQVIAHELNLPISMIQTKSPTSLTCPNSTPTWTSIGSELTVYAALDCCAQLNANLKPLKDSMKDATWKEIVQKAFEQSIPLSAYVGVGKLKEAPFGDYFVYGVSVTETEMDVITGQYQIPRVDILEDVGQSMSPMVDVGQVEGGFIMALGIHTTERNVYDPKTGALLTDRLWFYHIPRSTDIPIDFRITFIPNATNPNGILNSKATGEPALALAVSFINAMRYGLFSARSDSGMSDTWFSIDSPCSPETVLMASGTTKEQFKIQI